MDAIVRPSAPSGNGGGPVRRQGRGARLGLAFERMGRRRVVAGAVPPAAARIRAGSPVTRSPHRLANTPRSLVTRDVNLDVTDAKVQMGIEAARAYTFRRSAVPMIRPGETPNHV